MEYFRNAVNGTEAHTAARMTAEILTFLGPRSMGILMGHLWQSADKYPGLIKGVIIKERAFLRFLPVGLTFDAKQWQKQLQLLS